MHSNHMHIIQSIHMQERSKKFLLDAHRIDNIESKESTYKTSHANQII